MFISLHRIPHFLLLIIFLPCLLFFHVSFICSSSSSADLSLFFSVLWNLQWASTTNHSPDYFKFGSRFFSPKKKKILDLGCDQYSLQFSCQRQRESLSSQCMKCGRGTAIGAALSRRSHMQNMYETMADS